MAQEKQNITNPDNALLDVEGVVAELAVQQRKIPSRELVIQMLTKVHDPIRNAVESGVSVLQIWNAITKHSKVTVRIAYRSFARIFREYRHETGMVPLPVAKRLARARLEREATRRNSTVTVNRSQKSIFANLNQKTVTDQLKESVQ